MSDRARGYRLVVFDLDGTLVESRPAIAASLNHARQALGLETLSTPDVARHIGWGLDRLVGATVPAPLVGRAIELFRRHYGEHGLGLTELLPTVEETIVELARRGLALGVATNKPSAFVGPLLQGLGIADHFAVVLGADDVARPKPAPDMLNSIRERLGAVPEAVLYVGDMEIDLATATAAGVDFVGVCSGVRTAGELGRAGAVRILGRLDELLALPGLAGEGRAWRSP